MLVTDDPFLDIAGGSLVLLLILMVFALITVITADDTRQAFHSNFFLQALLAVTISLLFLLVVSYQAALINDELQMQR